MSHLLSSLWIWLCSGMSSLKLWQCTECVINLFNILELTDINLKSCGSKHLRDNAAIGEWNLIADTVFTTSLAQDLLESGQTLGDKVFCPCNLILLVFICNLVKDWQILKRLNPRVNYLYNLAHLSTLDWVWRQKWTLFPGLFKVLENGNAFSQSMPVYV